MAFSSTDTILITGGNGCLGRFLVEILQQQAQTHSSEPRKVIRILDSSAEGAEYFQERYGSAQDIFRIEYIAGDIRKASVVRRAVQGVQCVFHLAGIVDISIFPNENLMWAVNCRGTQDLLEACYEANVSYFIFTSSVNAVLGWTPLINATEDNCPKPKKWLYKGYGETKWFAEQMVKDADNLPLPNGRRMRTLSLRPTVFYGEYDKINIPALLRMAKNSGNKLIQFGNNDLKIQQTYVGNVAWAHFRALKALVESANDCAGDAYFITDNTPPANPFQFTRPFLEDRRMQLSGFIIPFNVVYYALLVILFFFDLVKRMWPDWDTLTRSTLPSKAQVTFLKMGISFDRSKAERLLRYTPFYTSEESLKRSREYYANVSL